MNRVNDAANVLGALQFTGVAPAVSARVMRYVLAVHNDRRTTVAEAALVPGEALINSHYGRGWRLQFRNNAVVAEAADTLCAEAYYALTRGDLADYILQGGHLIAPIPETHYAKEIKETLRGMAIVAVCMGLVFLGLVAWAKFYAG